MSTLTLQEKAEAILKKAEEKGVQTDFFFLTTFKRYQVQMSTLTELEKAIKEHGPLVEKEYIKGRRNITVNPAITEYNKTATARNNTVATLINIVKSLSEDTGEKRGTKLEQLMKELNE